MKAFIRDTILYGWLAALIGSVGFFLLIAWTEHDPRDGGHYVFRKE